MTAERWSRIKEVFGAALELPDDERSAFLDRTCGSEPSVREQVEKLLEAEREPLENPILEAITRAAPRELARGEMLGPYRIETKIGRGGMGVVYRAWDTRLDRRIALKVLRQEQVRDPLRPQLLLAEARAASALIHPNIVTVHDIGSDRDIDFIAMEHVEGRPLQEAIPASGLPPKQVAAYGIQIANALAAAHAAGIVHGDLKPGNIMITPEGAVKLLDFGLARKTRSADTTGTAPAMNGVIAGTPQYMAPELLRGDPIDHRADIFSLGVVLYRMLAGRDLFESGSVESSIETILEGDIVQVCKTGPAIHPALETVILHCLEKAPADRFQSARDVAYAIEAATQLIPAPPVAPPRKWKTYGGWAAGLLLAGIAGAISAYVFSTGNRVRPSVDGRTFAQVTDDAGPELFPSLSADGRTVVYASKAAGNWDIYLQQLGSSDTVDLTKDSPVDDTQPAFSPDGKQIAFRSERDGGGIFVMNRDGTTVRRVADSGYNPAWSPDGAQIAYAEESITRPEDRSGRVSQLWVVDVSSGNRRSLGSQDGVQPQWSPNGQYLAYWAIDRDGDRDLWTVRVSGGPPTRVTRDHFLDWNPVWSPDGAWLYFCSNRAGSMEIWRVPMKEGVGEPRGVPEPVRSPAQYPAHLTFSRDGHRMAYVNQLTTGHLSAVRFDPEREVVVSEPKEILKSTKGASRPALSPDGKWLAYNSTEQEEELFISGVDGSGMRQLTSGGYRNRGPRWSPDGSQLAFFSTRSGDWEIWTMQASGDQFRQVTKLAGYNVAWPVWSPDGKRLAYTLFGTSTYLVDAAKAWSPQNPEKLPPYPDKSRVFNGWNWSPDGRMLAGFLDRENGIAIYSPASGVYRTLTDHGADPVWLSDSRRLLFLDRGKIYVLDIEQGRTRELVSVFPEEIARRGFAVSPDDRQVYFSVSTTEADVWMVEFDR